MSAAKKRNAKRYPFRLFISLKTQRLYVRQAHEPVFDAPVTIAEPDKPIGTLYLHGHRLHEPGQRPSMDGRLTAAAHGGQSRTETLDRKGARRISRCQVRWARLNAALDRITLPPEVMARVSGSVWSGSSLIVSDEEMSKETGQATDFVVLISGEPQGGLKKR